MKIVGRKSLVEDFCNDLLVRSFFGKVTIVGLDAIIFKTKFKILEIFTHITHKLELWSFEVRHDPTSDTKSNNRTVLYLLRESTWPTNNNMTCSHRGNR